MELINQIENKIDSVGKLQNYLGIKDSYSNESDVRSITVHSLCQTTQNYLFALILSKSLLNVDFCKENISDQLESTDLPTVSNNFDGFIKNGFFINCFVYIENHLRQIAIHYESSKGKLNDRSITQTFLNLTDKKKISYFSTVSEDEIKLFKFFCYLRNTMHNAGFQNGTDKSIEINDSDSVIKTDKTELKLIKDQANNISFNEQLLLIEQICKLILKINSLIPESDYIEHRFVELGYNE